jgi:hypothetical protein
VSTARKPVIVRKLTRDWCAGYAASNPAGSDPTNDSSELELLLSSGKLITILWSQIKWLCYVREIGVGEGSGNDTVNPERLLRRRFTSRPRAAGVWLRLTLSDGEELEGIANNDRSLVDGTGLLLTPPDTRSNTQRVFIPRSSIREVTVLGVVNPSIHSSINPSMTRGDRAGLQPDLFAREPGADGQNDEPAP